MFSIPRTKLGHPTEDQNIRNVESPKSTNFISCGNFHGEYPAKTLDILAIGIHEMASISERRIERFCNPKSSGEGQDSLPAFLAPLGN